MLLSGRFVAALFVVCQSILSTCPAYCPSMRAHSDRNEAQTSSSHQHHHPGHAMAGAAGHQDNLALVAVLTSTPCNNCGTVVSALLVRTAEPFSTKLVADVQVALHGMRPCVARVPERAPSHPPDTSPPSGISPLRI